MNWPDGPLYDEMRAHLDKALAGHSYADMRDRKGMSKARDRGAWSRARRLSVLSDAASDGTERDPGLQVGQPAQGGRFRPPSRCGRSRTGRFGTRPQRRPKRGFLDRLRRPTRPSIPGGADGVARVARITTRPGLVRRAIEHEVVLSCLGGPALRNAPLPLNPRSPTIDGVIEPDTRVTSPARAGDYPSRVVMAIRASVDPEYQDSAVPRGGAIETEVAFPRCVRTRGTTPDKYSTCRQSCGKQTTP